MRRAATPAMNAPWSQVPADVADLLRPHLEAAATEMMHEIRASVPEYARPPNSRYGERMHRSVSRTVGLFVDAIGRPEVSLDPITEIYREIGTYEARHGRGLDGLQTAIRVSGQVACRRFIRDAYRLDWPREVLGLITESLFVFLEEAARAGAQGYAEAQARLATERERHRSRLCALLVADPPAGHRALLQLAGVAGWDAPRTIAVIALSAPDGAEEVPVLPAAVLEQVTDQGAFLIIPDPDGPGQERLISASVRGRGAALGPTVPLTCGAVSLRWANHGLSLVEKGILAPEPVARPRAQGRGGSTVSGPERRGEIADRARVVRCVDHLPTLVASMSRDLVAAAAASRLGALQEIPAARRDPLVRTLLTYMASGDNAVVTARMLHIHQQTVRYRIRRLEELCGVEIFEPAHRLEVMIILHAWCTFEDFGLS